MLITTIYISLHYCHTVSTNNEQLGFEQWHPEQSCECKIARLFDNINIILILVVTGLKEHKTRLYTTVLQTNIWLLNYGCR